jgi:hypothetical protein
MMKTSMDSAHAAGAWPELRSGPLITGGILIGIGGVIALVGLAIAGGHAAAATRQWINDMDVPPNQLAKLKWEQAKAATTVGVSAWREHPNAHVHMAGRPGGSR